MKKLLFLLTYFLLNNIFATTIYIPKLSYESNIIHTLDFNPDVYNNAVKSKIINSNLFNIYNKNFHYIESSESAIPYKGEIAPDYILIGNIINLSKENSFNQIIGTDKLSDIYSINILVSYQLINPKTHEIIMAFNSYGTGGDARLINIDEKQKQIYNNSKLINLSAQDLANEVLLNLQKIKIIK